LKRIKSLAKKVSTHLHLSVTSNAYGLRGHCSSYTKTHLISTSVEMSSPKELSTIGTDFLRMLWTRPPSIHLRIDWPTTCLYFPAAKHHRPSAGTHCNYPYCTLKSRCLFDRKFAKPNQFRVSLSFLHVHNLGYQRVKTEPSSSGHTKRRN